MCYVFLRHIPKHFSVEPFKLNTKDLKRKDMQKSPNNTGGFFERTLNFPSTLVTDIHEGL